MALQKLSYKEARPQMKPGDVIAFGGKGHFSEIIKFAKIYLPLTLVISMAVSAGCAPESEEPLELIGLKTDGSLPTPEQMKRLQRWRRIVATCSRKLTSTLLRSLAAWC